MVSRQIALRVVEDTQVGEARRKAAAMASRLGMDEHDRGRLAIVVTELASNLARHARDGELLLRTADDALWYGMEVIALDRGPGINSMSEALRDGHSTAGSSGTGLGAVRRTADMFDIYSQPGRGTVVLARINPRPVRKIGDLRLGVVSLPVRGEEVSGDDWGIKQRWDSIRMLVVDGLGHGAIAAHAAIEAARIFQETPANENLKSLLEGMHLALRSTRGAAAGIADLDSVRGQVRYAAVGNISAAVLAPDSLKNLMYQNGTLGHEMRTVREVSYPLSAGATVLLHSDGLTRWSLDAYPGLLSHHPAILTAVLYRDFRRNRDDVTVLAVRAQEPQ